MHARKLREESNLQSPQSEDWSSWKKAMVPENIQGHVENRGAGQDGFMWSNIRNFTDEMAESCGIYEWRAIRVDQPNRVVYVGSTCTRYGQFPRLRSRILGYCRNGNHKKDLINDALNKGYVLEVRYKEADDENDAREQENELLAKYNYPWNARNNAVRDVLQP